MMKSAARIGTVRRDRGAGLRTPLVEIHLTRAGFLMPFRCALLFWLWLVWFLLFAMAAVPRAQRGASTKDGAGTIWSTQPRTQSRFVDRAIAGSV